MLAIQPKTMARSLRGAAGALALLCQLAGNSSGEEPQRLRVQTFWGGMASVRALTSNFVGDRPHLSVQLRPASSERVLLAVASGEADVGLSLRAGPCVRPPAGDARVRHIPLARFAVAVIVSAANDLDHLSRDELADVFRGRRAQWRELPQPTNLGHIELYSPLLTSTPTVVFRDCVMPESGFAVGLWEGAARDERQKSNVEALVASVARERAAIAFIPLGPTRAPDEKRVRVLGISEGPGQAAARPSAECLADGTYPICATLDLVVRQDHTAIARQFCEYATGAEGARCVKQFDLWPECDLEKLRGESRLKDMNTGRGSAIRICGLQAHEPLAKDLAIAYVRSKALVQVNYNGHTSTGDAAEAFLSDGELLVIPRALGKEMMEGERWIAGRPQEGTLGALAVGVLIHPANGVKDLTLEDLQQVYSGAIDKWPDADGTAAKIRIFGLPSDSGVMNIVDEKIGSGGRHARVEQRSDAAKVILSVANQPGAIGFVDLAAVSKTETSVKLVAIVPPGKKEAKPPTSDKLPEGYPLAQPVMLYLSPKASETAKDFFEFVAEGNAREALLAHGIIPNPNPPKLTKDNTLAAVKKHFEEGEPQIEKPKATPEPEELAIAIPKGPTTEEEAKAEAEASPPEDSQGAAPDRDDGKSPSTEKKNQKSEAGSDGTDTKYFIFGMAGLLIVGAALIGVNTVAAKRRRERLRKYRR